MGKRKKHELDIDFIAPHSIEQCAYLLGRLDDRREIPYAPPVRVRLDYVDDNTYAFRLNEDAPAPLIIHGFLNRLHDDSTYVSGIAITRRHVLYREMIVGSGLILGLALLVGPIIFVLYVPVFAVFVLRYRRGVELELGRLTRVVGDMLSH